MSNPDSVEARYRAKLVARANGTAKVVVTPPAEVRQLSPQGTEADQRYAAKLRARAMPVVAPAPTLVAPVEPAVETPVPVAEEKPAPVADKPKKS